MYQSKCFALYLCQWVALIGLWERVTAVLAYRKVSCEQGAAPSNLTMGQCSGGKGVMARTDAKRWVLWHQSKWRQPENQVTFRAKCITVVFHPTILTLSGIASGSGKVDGEHRRNLVRVFSNMNRCQMPKLDMVFKWFFYPYLRECWKSCIDRGIYTAGQMTGPHGSRHGCTPV